MLGFSTFLLAISYVCGEALVVNGPVTTAVQLGSDFTLICTVTNKADEDSVIWSMVSINKPLTNTLLTLDTTSKVPARYSLQNGTYNLIVKNATVDNDATYKCEVGQSFKTARVYVYDLPDKMTLDWAHMDNGPNSVQASNAYTIICTSENSYPIATHTYYKNGVPLNSSAITYQFNNYSTGVPGYGDTTSFMPFTPSQVDITSMSTIKCGADLYTQQSASSISFRINSASQAGSVSVLLAIMMTVAQLLS